MMLTTDVLTAIYVSAAVLFYALLTLTAKPDPLSERGSVL
jgi:hypothetical protein